MKNPISFLTFATLSLSVCLLAQYMTSHAADEFFNCLFSVRGSALKTAFWGFCRLAQLFFGIFACIAAKNDRFVTVYFFVFSQLLYIAVNVLLFNTRAYIFSSVWALILVFFTLILLLSHSPLRKSSFFVLPQLIAELAFLGFSFAGFFYS